MKTPPAHPARCPWRPALSILAALVLAQAGCSYPKAVHTYEYLSDYERMTDRFDPVLSLVYMPRDVKFSRYDGVIIGPVSLGEQWISEPEKARLYTTYFRCMVQKQLLRINKFDTVTLDPDFTESTSDPSKLLRLEGKITKFYMGWGLMRWLSYSLRFLSSGATDFQVEGRLTDAGTGDLVMEFADRRRHLGNTPWGPNPKTFNDHFVMKITLDQTAACLARFVEEAYDGLPSESGQTEIAASDEETPTQ